MDSNQDDLVAQFTGITGAPPASARAGLEAANWNLQEAVQLYFAAQEDPQDDDEEDNDEPTTSSSAQPSSSTGHPPRQRRQHMTLEDLKKMASDEEGDADDDDKQQDMFAGGEKSGLAVQKPDQGGTPKNHFQNIMKQAQQNRERPAAAGEEPEQPPRPSNFQGRAQTLGGEGAESQVVEDPMQRARERMQRQQRERVTRTMHLWADGVSIDDGPLFRFDDPANQAMMAEINRGRAPMQLLDVQPDQEVDLNLEPHKDENYVQPKTQYKPFSGQGQRLGSPTPGPAPSTSSTSSTATTSAPATSTPASSSAEPPKQEVDESAPTVQLQIRLADGTRLPSRFNTTHTIGDVYAFVNRASPESSSRAYALMTTFPSKELDDKSQVLGDMSDFKRGGVVVQKWK